MQVPTKYSETGEILSHGLDFNHYVGVGGRVLYWVDADGAARGLDFITTDGISLTSLNTQVQNIIFTGLPSSIDAGTF